MLFEYRSNGRKLMIYLFFQEITKKKDKLIRYCISKAINITGVQIICLNSPTLLKNKSKYLNNDQEKKENKGDRGAAFQIPSFYETLNYDEIYENSYVEEC